ncbi:hypothetical protein AnigIFM56816_006823 [Aspergillus niger]|nr:hypothetical protein AnigIFM56816_006823 [Aspergillus niger]
MGGNLWLPGEVGILRGCKRDPKISPNWNLDPNGPSTPSWSRRFAQRQSVPCHATPVWSQAEFNIPVAPTSASSVKSRSEDGSPPARSMSRELALGEARLRVARRVKDPAGY